MNEGTQGVELVDQAVERAAAPWLVWSHIPEPLRVPSRSLIAVARRMRARSSALPDGPLPELPAAAVELRTKYGSFWFDARDRKVTPWVRRHATWEADVLRFAGSVVRPGMVTVDVGANVGFHSVMLAKLVGPLGRVHAYEPLAETLQFLRANLWRHGCANAVVHPAAALDRAGVVSFERDPEGDSGAHVQLDAATAIQVPTTTLDEELGGGRVDFLKIDVEGAEPLVLEGARAVIEASPKLDAVVEFRGGAHLDGRGPDEVLDLYDSLGLRAHQLLPDGRAVAASRAELLAAAARDETINIVLRK